jgi:trehalose 6-phosphate synthase/phosphatase
MRISVNNLLSGLTEKAVTAKCKLILLDFDGTLVDFTSYPANTSPSEELLGLLKNIAGTAATRLIIITGRRKDDIERLIGHLPIDIIVEHGAKIREKGIWRTLTSGRADWKEEIYPVLLQFNKISHDAYIEEKSFSLAWHFRNVEHQTGKANSQELINVLQPIVTKHDLRILNGKKVVEIISKFVSKGFATRYLTEKYRYDFILSIGDDTTDEDMFKVLNGLDYAFTIKTGRGKTYAKYKLDNIRQVLKLLEQFQSIAT